MTLSTSRMDPLYNPARSSPRAGACATAEQVTGPACTPRRFPGSSDRPPSRSRGSPQTEQQSWTRALQPLRPLAGTGPPIDFKGLMGTSQKAASGSRSSSSRHPRPGRAPPRHHQVDSGPSLRKASYRMRHTPSGITLWQSVTVPITRSPSWRSMPGTRVVAWANPNECQYPTFSELGRGSRLTARSVSSNHSADSARALLQ